MIGNFNIWHFERLYVYIRTHKRVIREILLVIWVPSPRQFVSRAFNSEVFDEISVSMLLEHLHTLRIRQNIEVTTDNFETLLVLKKANELL